jgi:hypothetical protein
MRARARWGGVRLCVAVGRGGEEEKKIHKAVKSNGVLPPAISEMPFVNSSTSSQYMVEYYQSRASAR